MNEENRIIINEQVSIPLSELQFRFSTSSGPGGQHADRTASRAILLFDVAGSPSLDEGTRARLLKKLSSWLNKEGVLRLEVQESRSQWRNRETAVARFQTLMAEALMRRKRRRKTKPTQDAKEKRLEEKKRRGIIKKGRGRQWDPE